MSLFAIAATATALHFAASLMPNWLVMKYGRSSADAAERMRQHHELCTMLGLLVLAILQGGKVT